MPGADEHGTPPDAVDAGTPAPSAVSREVTGAMAWSLAAKFLVSLLAIGSNILIIRGLGEYAYGVYSIYLNIARFFSLGIGLGLAQAILRFLPEMRVKQDARGARQVLASACLLQLGSWVLVLGLAYLLRGRLSDLQHADLRVILPLGTLLLIFESFWSVFSSIYTAVRRMGWLTVVSVAQKAALIVLLLLFARSPASVQSLLYIVAGSFILGILLLAPGLPRILPWTCGAAGEGLPLARNLGYALPIALAALINQILWRSSDTLVIGYYRTPEEVGFYNAAYNLAQMVLEFVPLAIWPVVLASLSEVHALKPTDLARGTRLYFRLLFVLVIPLTVTGLVLGGTAYQVMYGNAMAPGAPLCQAFFLVFLIGFFATPLRMALFVKERVMVNLWVGAVGAAINIALDLLLIPAHGMWGAVWAVAVALLVSGGLQYLVTRRDVPGLAIPWDCGARVLLASSVALLLWPLRGQLAAPLPLVGALAGVTLLQFLLLRVLRVFGEEERTLLQRSNLPLKRWLLRLLGMAGGA
jgi:O-antigen/teichoic acid export membrane protein